MSVSFFTKILTKLHNKINRTLLYFLIVALYERFLLYYSCRLIFNKQKQIYLPLDSECIKTIQKVFYVHCIMAVNNLLWHLLFHQGNKPYMLEEVSCLRKISLLIIVIIKNILQMYSKGPKD